MKILYITSGNHIDYQDDCLLIGLKELFGSDVVDINKKEHIYTSYDSAKVSSLYGRGFTVSRVIPEDNTDRTDIESKIKNKFFDLVVYGSIWRSDDDIDKVLQYYPKEKVIAVDGEDETNLHQVYNLGILYFKRELILRRERLFPISFAIPTCKIFFNKNKIRDNAFITPLDKKTYIYDNESDYYNDYSLSRFAITTKKAGWDCMRHYEILANGCLPLFYDIDKCPDLTMVSFPKKLCKLILTDRNYEIYADDFENHFWRYNTTKALAEMFISKVNK